MRWTEAYFIIKTIGMWVDIAFGAVFLLFILGIVICYYWPSKGGKKK